MKFKKLQLIFTTVIAFSLFLSGCTKSTSSEVTDTSASQTSESQTFASQSSSSQTSAGEKNTAAVSEAAYPITIKHAFGETVIKSKPKRVATISWGNQDLPLALGVIPVGISKANYGVTDNSGLLPWTMAKYKELGVNNPVLFDDVAGLNFEAISDVKPDVILAAYSGITLEEYNLLSEIAPVVAYPTQPWQTFWRDQIVIDATGMGMKAEGEALVSGLEALIGEKAGKFPQIAGKTAAFFYFTPTDLSKFYVYLPSDPRAAYLTDLGMKFPESVTKLAAESNSFALEISAENVDILQGIDIMVTYGNNKLLAAMQADALVGTIPAVKRGSVAVIEDGTPLAASGTPSALSIPATIDDYLQVIGEAADKVK